MVVKVDLSKNKSIRDGWGFIRNRRPDTYKPLIEDVAADITLKDKESFVGKTPHEMGYRMAAEWEKHDAIWLSWPHDPTTFPNCIEKVGKLTSRLLKTFMKVNMSTFCKRRRYAEKSYTHV